MLWWNYWRTLPWWTVSLNFAQNSDFALYINMLYNSLKTWSYDIIFMCTTPRECRDTMVMVSGAHAELLLKLENQDFHDPAGAMEFKSTAPSWISKKSSPKLFLHTMHQSSSNLSGKSCLNSSVSTLEFLCKVVSWYDFRSMSFIANNCERWLIHWSAFRTCMNVQMQ